MKTNYKFIETNQLYLRPFISSDEESLAPWYNDPEVRSLIGSTRPCSQSQLGEHLVKKSSDAIWFAIVRKSDDQVIGETGLLRMFPDWSCSDMSIMIYDPQYRQCGYGKEIMQAMLAYAFGDLHFHRIAIGVVGFNQDAIRFYERCGFKKEGIQEQGYYYHFKYYDFIMMRILKDEFLALQ